MSFKSETILFQSPTSVGTQDINHNLGEAPALMLFYGVLRTALDSPDLGGADSVFLSGFAAYNNPVITQYGVSGGADTANSAQHMADNCLHLTQDGGVPEKASLTLVDSTKIRLNWENITTSQYYYAVVLIAGIEVEAGYHLLGSSGTTDIMHSLGNDAQLFYSIHPNSRATLDYGRNYVMHNLGACDRNLNQYAVGTSKFSSNSRSASAWGKISYMVDYDGSSVEQEHTVTTFDSTKVTITHNTSSFTSDHFYIFIGGANINGGVGKFNTSTIAQDVVTGLDFKPQLILLNSAGQTSDVSHSNGLMLSYGAGSSSTERVNHVNSAFFMGLADNYILRLDTNDDGASEHVADLASLDSDGFTLDNDDVTRRLANIRVFYIALGDTLTVVQNSLVGASTNSGVISSKYLLSSFIQSASSNIGSLSTRILSIISEAVAGISSSEGVISRTIDYRRTVGHDSANTGELTRVVKGGIQIKVDRLKQLPADLNLGLGDETGFNNILTNSPVIEHLHPDEKVKNLKVKYRKNNRENDIYLHEIERSSSSNGVDQTINLPFVYDHATADMVLDYKRKRFAAAVKRMSLEVGQDAAGANRSDLATVDIPSLGVSSNWEITGTNVTPAGSQNLSLVPYSASPYNYVSFVSEGGTLPVDTGFDIPADISNTPPDPVSNLSATGSARLSEQSDRSGVLDISWTVPDDGNYSGGEIFIRESSGGTYKSYGVHFDGALIEGLKANTSYDVQVISIGEVATNRGLPREALNRTTGTSTSAPDDPSTAPIGSRSGRTVTFRANAPSSTYPLKDFDWQVDFQTGGTDHFILRTGLTISVTVSGTGNFSVRARFRPRNVFEQLSDNYSPYSSYISNEQWQQGHMGDNSIGFDQMQSNSVGNFELRSGAVDRFKIQDGEIVRLKIGEGEVDKLRVADLAVDQFKRINVFSTFIVNEQIVSTQNRKVRKTINKSLPSNFDKIPTVAISLDYDQETHDRIIASYGLERVTTGAFTVFVEFGNFGGGGAPTVTFDVDIHYW